MLKSLAPTQRTKLIQSLPAETALALVYDWRIWARDAQLPPDGDWLWWLVLAGRGFGKALGLGVDIPTPTGWTTMGDLRVGDMVFDERGRPCTVTFATEVMHDHVCYDVVFDDGTVIIADAEHLWLTKTRAVRKAERRRVESQQRAGRPQCERRHFPRVVTTEEIRASLIDCGERNHSIDIAPSLELPTAALPIDPYVLGAWLGDGDSACAVLTSADPEIVAEIRAAGCQVGPGKYDPRSKAVRYQLGAAPYRRDPKTGRMLANGSLHSSLKALGLLRNKHVPPAYLRASAAQRMALLQGLMDTDGSVTPAGHCEFTVTNERLFRDVQELVLTLGFKAVGQTDRAMLEGRDCGPRYRLTFTPHVPVFRLSRKLARQHPGKAQAGRVARRYVVDVRPRPSVPVRCITVDSPSHLYLASRSFVPTHNTRTGAEFVRQRVAEGARAIALIGPTAADVRDVMIETGPGSILKNSPPWDMPEYEPSKRRLTWKNGAVATAFSADEPERLRGPQHDTIWCFVAGTMVRTPEGEVPIETIRAGDLVMTRRGPRPVVATGSHVAPLASARFSDGAELVGTPDHPVRVADSWVPLADLRAGDRVVTWNDGGGATLRATGTATRKAGSSTVIAYCGSCTTVRSPMGSTCTTSTTPRATTASRTSRCAPLGNIAPSTLRRVDAPSAAGAALSASGRCTHQRPQAARGVLRPGRTETEARTCARASTAVRSSAPVAGTTVASDASTWGLAGRVFNLTVAEQPEFFANGVLVHNCDELAAWKYLRDTWDMAQFGFRLGEPRGIITTTPRPTPVLKELLKDPTVRITGGSTYENAANLAKSFLAKLLKRYEGTRLGRQELYAQLLEDTPGALWTLKLFEATRVTAAPDLARVAVAIDPQAADPDEDPDADDAAETGIVAGGVGENREGYILRDASGRFSPGEWGERAVLLHDELSADAIVGETNNGGAMVGHVVTTAAEKLFREGRRPSPRIVFRAVSASRGKHTRAEPISALFEQSRAHCVGVHAKLEDQSSTWVPGEKSPDRMDAMVWLLTHLMLDAPAPGRSTRVRSTRR